MYEALIFIDKSTDMDIASYSQSVKEFYEASSGHKPKISISESNANISFYGIGFEIKLDCSNKVKTEALKVSEKAKPDVAPMIAESKCVLGLRSSPDYDMSYFNDYLFLIQAAEKLGKVWAFDPVQGEFM